MKNFIEIVDKYDNKHLINIRYIEEVVEKTEDSCYIYLAHNCPDAVEQDYYLVKEPYDVIKMAIERKVGAKHDS